jgi:hypothetical protein
MNDSPTMIIFSVIIILQAVRIMALQRKIADPFGIDPRPVRRLKNHRP